MVAIFRSAFASVATLLALGLGMTAPANAQPVTYDLDSNPYDLRPIIPRRASVVAVDETSVMLAFNGQDKTELFSIDRVEAAVLEPGMIIYEADERLYVDAARTPISPVEVLVLEGSVLVKPAFEPPPRPEVQPPVRALW
ncbi:hypothetical protein KR51_00005860 [Rubidibacter lacunae KORDI 51-2]|uniref:Uncharacterized protein n=1 Tax=Rubidibacter lacunae KORDI 51-2 TaxID=582515 RepID=U5DE04_9CHRO|nr:hypothetical protein [Rubidibacter lacunae]ERN42738.1 hypothetical protein KR51_00005860 [Rubidibacter lacunae KORDI 51-2]